MLIPLWILLSGCCYVQAQDKPPPTLTGLRKWEIPDTTPNGTVIQTLSATLLDSPDEEFEYGLEQSFDFNSYREPLPFNVHPKTGEVFTNQSLIKLGGKDIILYATVRVKDSELTAKNQIWTQIIKSSDKKSGHGASSNSNLKHSGHRTPELPTHLRPASTSVKPTSVFNGTTTALFSNSTVKSGDWGIKSSDNSTRMKNDETESTSTRSLTVKTVKEPELIPAQEPTSKLIIALIPSIVIITSLLISGFVACLFRKKICKKRSKMKKDDMKKSTCSVLSLEESMVLRHWRGARGLNSRYNSWDSDSNHNQNGTALTNSKSTDKWEIPRHHIKVFSILGEGCFGQVWKCEALNIDNKEGPMVVAVKMLKENAGEQERNDLLQELQVMKMLDPHPNVVRLLGCCTDKDPVFVIMEYVSNGKLQSFLRHSRAQRYYNNMHGSSNTLTSHDLTSFCYQIAKGMQYLSSKGIIHRDLAARNILVGENHTCKVADFGFARDIMTSIVYERKSEGRLPIRWMAPESLYDNIFSVKSDIWSFGVLVWEIVTLGSTPYPGIPAAEVMRRVRDGYRLDKPEHCRRELYNIMYYCWDKDPKERPTFTELVDLLETLLLSETDYIQLERFPDHSYYNMVSLSGEKL